METYSVIWVEAEREGKRMVGNTKETRVTASTGGQKGSKLAKFFLIPPDALYLLAEHYGKGEEKYPTDENGVPNFRKGYPNYLSFDALMRHAWQWQAGEDIDPETGSHHMIAAAWHALCIVQHWLDFPEEFESRPNVRRRVTNDKWGVASIPNARILYFMDDDDIIFDGPVD
ncbi:MAG: dATP/dGTP diphosphohydrolase domain-containing protein [Bacteroidota bacterium]